ncbi:hypothetical protein COY88_01405 [Candidatus Roizmanbacteria bacterium CG_4_10_14_0_8_um_filter_35_28]|uniref:Phage holin family protein n=3 Tax=Candidatus Roizmaniibacteriota TaxID=1752723 RepID=A0A2M8F151_9BACT|nr:MAG: hypothetical protein COX47_02825 [Candidatus Roizmanbacteria bacterium CG23_combo_of_CG06-09_8_20_14_all_35_49]PIY71226.1 MAG: hypothetical protein COY88_01405 [Candidatus Roizmanbacteria bacterium CG_4_10_14_0_8_um_filter_35_28]PJC33018.1 MAG: hypothetical protein CO048_03900 [Candidatus Roizmanbacteria bacterium CG_4_9_14_0_2_um_filter_35_15]PJC82797.1 MAG: hypothetical protein CO006_01715 [Candidatus Roizmanbacteria bacterium CG_4_8_14_3_um_filter_35_14]
MKKLFRMIIFSAIALFLTSLWNKGFIIKPDFSIYLKATLLIAFIYYLIVPLSKVILLPLNLLTLGFVSVVFYCFLFYFLANYFSLIIIKGWTFSGVGSIKLNSMTNIFVSAISVSTIINLLGKIL